MNWSISLDATGSKYLKLCCIQGVFALAPSLHSFWSYFSTDLQEHIGHLWPGEFLFQCPIILPSHTVHGALKARMLEWFALPSPVDHILSDLSTMTQPSWLSVTELDAAVILGSDWLVSVMMVLVCLPSDALSQHLPSYLVSLTSDVGYLFTAAPAKRSRCSLPWRRAISSRPPLLTLNMK